MFNFFARGIIWKNAIGLHEELYLTPKRTHEREILMKRLRELDQEIAESQRELWELKRRQAARLPLEEQFAFYLRKYLHILK